MREFNISKQLTWCDGCGNYGITTAFRFALNESGLTHNDTLLCFDIGCNGNLSDKIEGYKAHTLHGRVLPIATGAKLARKDLNVIALAGDGATYAEGIGHFVHSIRNNYPIVFIVHDNSNYGLTTGQCSPTSYIEVPMNANPHGNTGKVLNPLHLALTLGCEFVAQGYSGDISSLKEIIKTAIKNTRENNSFSFVNILQTCPTYNKTDTDGKHFKTVINYTSSSYKKTSTLLQNEIHNELDLQEALKLSTEYKSFAGLLYKSSTSTTFLQKAHFDNIIANRQNEFHLESLMQT